MQIQHRLEILLWNIAIPIMRSLAAVRQALPLPEAWPRWDYKKLALLVTALVCAGAFSLYRLNPNPFAAQPAGSPSAVEAWAPGDQHNLLVIGVDQLNSPHPLLESAWLVIYSPGVPHFSFIPLFPLADNHRPDLEQAIQTAFNVNRDKTPSAAFLNALRSSGAWWHHYLLLDELALAELIDMSANTGLPERLTGLQLVAASLNRESAPSPVAAQARLISAVCRGAVAPILPQDINTVLAGFSDHLRTDMKPRQILSELRWLSAPLSTRQPDAANLAETDLPGGTTFACEFPTIQEEITFIGGQFGYP